MKCEEFDYDAYFNETFVPYESRENLKIKIKKQFRIIEILTNRFNDSFRGESRVELLFVSGTNISPQSSSTFGHFIRFPAQLVVDYYRFLDSCLGVQSFDLTNQRCRRVSIALMHALSHELSHNLKGHNVVTAAAGLSEDQTALASETDADFSAGMMSFLFIYNSNQTDEIHKLLSVYNNAYPIYPLSKDCGAAAVMLAFFIYSRSKEGKTPNYHSPNIRFSLISAGALFAIKKTQSQLEEFLISGVKEAIHSLEQMKSEEYKTHAKNFLKGNEEEFALVITDTAEYVEKLRSEWDKESDLIKIATKFMKNE